MHFYMLPLFLVAELACFFSAGLDWPVGSRYSEGSACTGNARALHRSECASTLRIRKNNTWFTMPSAKALVLSPDQLASA